MGERSRILFLLLVPLALVAGAVGAVRSREAPASLRLMRVTLPPADESLSLPEVRGPGGRPLVVIDAGHGGHDLGARGDDIVEKDIVLALSRALGDALVESGTARVALTRSDDRYLLHEERYQIARRLDADLFISIHADSAGEKGEVAGASIYTLSDAASSQAARRFAARENASDRINGADIGGQSEAVSSILVELSQRRTQEQSAELAALILRNAQGAIRFHPEPLRSAALKVLRAPDTPSVLFESGFITNREEAARLASLEGQRRFGAAVARAIAVYFARAEES